jgi:hypothetical protein
MAAGVRVMLRRLLQSSPTMYSVGDEEENSTVIIPTSPKSFMTIEKSCIIVEKHLHDQPLHFTKREDL